jgi:hypothetical protein
MHAEDAMSLFRNAKRQRDKQPKPERAESLHAD